MLIRNLVQDVNFYSGRLIELKGWLVMKNEDCYLTDIDCIEKNDDASIQIFHPNLREMLDEAVPAYGGGEFSYYHKAIIQGEIVVVNERAVLKGIVELTCFVNDHQFHVI